MSIQKKMLAEVRRQVRIARDADAESGSSDKPIQRTVPLREQLAQARAAARSIAVQTNKPPAQRAPIPRSKPVKHFNVAEGTLVRFTQDIYTPVGDTGGFKVLRGETGIAMRQTVRTFKTRRGETQKPIPNFWDIMTPKGIVSAPLTRVRNASDCEEE